MIEKSERAKLKLAYIRLFRKVEEMNRAEEKEEKNKPFRLTTEQRLPAHG